MERGKKKLFQYSSGETESCIETFLKGQKMTKESYIIEKLILQGIKENGTPLDKKEANRLLKKFYETV